MPMSDQIRLLRGSRQHTSPCFQVWSQMKMMWKDSYRIVGLAMLYNRRCARRYYASASGVGDSRDNFINMLNSIRSIERKKRHRSPAEADPSSASRNMEHIWASSLFRSYLSLPPSTTTYLGDKTRFDILQYLVFECATDVEEVLSIIQKLSHDDYHALQPAFKRMLQIIATESDHGLALSFLVQLREDVIRKIQYLDPNRSDKRSSDLDNVEEISRLKRLEGKVKDLLAVLFKAECLELKRISLDQTSQEILEKIALKDAVHPIESVDDLKKRLKSGRRCYALFHPSLPQEPLVIVHTVLVDQIPVSLEDLNNGNSDTNIGTRVAVFYSITNACPGLVGLDLGVFLIKSVMKILNSEYRDRLVFVTLSPIPGFRNWMVENKSKILDTACFFKNTDEKALLSTLLDVGVTKDHDCTPQIKVIQEAKGILMSLATQYLYNEKDNQLPLDKVARFHMRNGASIFRLNFLADPSPKGILQSYGIMLVNWIE